MRRNASVAKVSPPVAQPAAPPGAPAGPVSWRKRAFAWGLALVALAFVESGVPMRDRCADPSAPVATAARHQGGASAGFAGRNGVRDPPPGRGRASLGSRVRPAHLRARAHLDRGGAPGDRRGAPRPVLRRHARVGGALEGAPRPRARAAAARRDVAHHARVPGRRNRAPGGDRRGRAPRGLRRGKGATLADRDRRGRSSIARSGLVTLAEARGRPFRGHDARRCTRVPSLLLVLASIPVGFVVGLLVLRWKPIARAPFLVRGPLAPLARPVLEYVGEPGAPRAIVTGVAISLLVSATQLAVDPRPRRRP